MGDDKVVIFVQKRQAGRAGRRELDIGFVHNDNVVGVCFQHFLNGRDRGQQAGRGVGVGDDDRFMQTAVFFKVDGQIVLQRENVLRNVQKLTQHRVKAVGHIGKGQRCVLIAEGPQRKQQVFIAAVAAEDILRLDAPVPGNGGVQFGVAQVRVKPQPRHRRRHRRRHAGSGRVRVFIGVELDNISDFELFAGGIWLQRREGFGKITAHGCFSPSGI